MLKISISFLLFLISFFSFSQEQIGETFTLEQCISKALENNLDLKSSNFKQQSAKINYQQSIANLLPSINGQYAIGKSTGRNIDPFTNDYINSELTSSSANVNLNATIFNGFRLINTLKQQQLQKKSAEFAMEEAKQNLILEVTLAYLQVLKSRDVLKLAEDRLIATKKQLKRQKDQYDEALGNPADFTDIQAQKALDETAILSAESSYNNAKLRLNNLMNVDASISINLSDLLLSLHPYEFSDEQVFKDALENLATFKSKKYQFEAAKKGIAIAKSLFVPEISLFGQLSTNYSSAAKSFTETGSSVVETGDFVTIDSKNVSVLRNQPTYLIEDISFTNQFENNIGSAFGLSVQIPLFNGFRAKNNVSLQKIRKEESMVELQRTEQSVKNTIKQVHFNMLATYKKMQSLNNQVKAFEESYRVNEIRFNAGVSNYLSYITSKNNLESAKTNATNTKYEYVLLVKVLEYYRGEF